MNSGGLDPRGRPPEVELLDALEAGQHYAWFRGRTAAGGPGERHARRRGVTRAAFIAPGGGGGGTHGGGSTGGGTGGGDGGRSGGLMGGGTGGGCDGGDGHRATSPELPAKKNLRPDLL